MPQVPAFGSVLSMAVMIGPVAFFAGVCWPALGSLNVYHHPWRPAWGIVMPVVPSSKSEIVSGPAAQVVGRVLPPPPVMPP